MESRSYGGGSLEATSCSFLLRIFHPSVGKTSKVLPAESFPPRTSCLLPRQVLEQEVWNTLGGGMRAWRHRGNPGRGQEPWGQQLRRLLSHRGAVALCKWRVLVLTPCLRTLGRPGPHSTESPRLQTQGNTAAYCTQSLSSALLPREPGLPQHLGCSPAFRRAGPPCHPSALPWGPEDSP